MAKLEQYNVKKTIKELLKDFKVREVKVIDGREYYVCDVNPNIPEEDVRAVVEWLNNGQD